MQQHSEASTVRATPVTGDIAVVIVNYNGGDYLSRCLESVQQQTLKPRRILVMDNASSDGSALACAARFPEVEFHHMGANLGFAVANNRAAALCDDCRWLALLNPDAYALPDWLARLMDGTVRHPDCAMFASCMLYAPDPSLIDDFGLAYNTGGISWPRHRGSALDSVGRQPPEVFAPSGGAALYLRSAFIDAGGFDERFFCYYEDIDLGFRLRLYGHRCALLPEAIVHHTSSALTGGQQGDFTIYHAHRNMIWVFVKNMPSIHLWRFLPMHVLMNVAIVISFARKGRGKLLLRTKWDALRALPDVWRERRRIQQLRCAAPGEVVSAIEPASLRLLARRLLGRRSTATYDCASPGG